MCWRRRMRAGRGMVNGLPGGAGRTPQRSASSSTRMETGIPAPWPAALLDADQHRPAALSVDLLEPRGVLEGVAGGDPVVVVGGGHQRRREVLVRGDVVVGRVGAQHREHLRVVRVAVVPRPRPSRCVNRWKRSMSITPTAGSAAPKSSGRWFSTAPTSSPPFEPPAMASREGRVTESWIRNSGGGDEVVEDVFSACSPAFRRGARSRRIRRLPGDSPGHGPRLVRGRPGSRG